MSPVEILILRSLVFAEPFAALGASLAWIRAGKRNSGFPAMRDYLVVRFVAIAVGAYLFYLNAIHRGIRSLETAYQYEYWIGFFVIAWFMLRLSGATLQRSLESLPGLQALAASAFRWVLAVALLLALPAAVGIAMVFGRPGLAWREMYSFFSAIAIAQLFPIVFVLVVASYAGCRVRGRAVGIMFACCLEPAWLLILTQFHPIAVLNWTNLVNEFVCYAAFGLWTWYAFHPDREDRLPRPNATLQHWDQIARRALRHRLPEIEEEEAVIQGARPWPQPRK